MVVGEVVNTSADIGVGLIGHVGEIALWLQALGVVIIAWFIFQIIALIVNRKNRKRIKKMIGKVDNIQRDVKRIEEKLDSLLNKSKKGKKS